MLRVTQQDINSSLQFGFQCKKVKYLKEEFNVYLIRYLFSLCSLEKFLSYSQHKWKISNLGTDNVCVQLIRDEIHAGKSDKEIFKKLEEDFGETVLYAPKFDLQTAALWLSPVSLRA